MIATQSPLCVGLLPIACKRMLAYPRGTGTTKNRGGTSVPRVALTDRFCSAAKAIGARTDYFDATVPGLALRVTGKGHRSWCYLYTSPRDGKRTRATIGTYPATSLAAARGKALEARGHIEAGQDPRIKLPGQSAAGMTIAALVDAYLADPEKAALRSKAEIARRLRKNVVPIIGEVRIADLRRRDVRNVTDAILRRGKKVEATRVFEDVRAMVRWANENEYLDANPLDGMSKPAEATSSNRVLSDDEIRSLWGGLHQALSRSVQCQRIVKLCLVTAQRVGEVAGMLRSEIDLTAREWRLPGSRTKNGHSHVVPLSELAIQVIGEAMADSEPASEPLFPCGNGSLSPVAVARTILRAHEIRKDRPRGRFGIAPWSAHDLRRTALTGMARLGVAPIVLGHVANHRTTTRAGVTLAVYSQYTYDKEKRAALDLWADRLASITKGAAAMIIPIKAASR
jgi:integrase